MKKKENKMKYEKGILIMQTTVQKWGNSLAIRIPKDIASKAGLEQGTEMQLMHSELDNQIKLIPKKTPKTYSLDELLSQCHSDNRHSEIDTSIEGNELI